MALLPVLPRPRQVFLGEILLRAFYYLNRAVSLHFRCPVLEGAVRIVKELGEYLCVSK